MEEDFFGEDDFISRRSKQMNSSGYSAKVKRVENATENKEQNKKQKNEEKEEDEKQKIQPKELIVVK